MAIRFTCQSCQQPIEVDDQWAGQSVACPYCEKVITAPRESTLPDHDIPEATPAGSGLRPPPPPPGQTSYASQDATGSGKKAQWALLLSSTSAVLCVLAWFFLMAVVMEKAMDIAGEDADAEQLNKVIQEMSVEQNMPVPTSTKAMAVIGTLCGLGGIILAIQALVQSTSRKGMAITALVIGLSFQLCQIPLSLMVLFPAPAGG
jgi:hypothetical protein